MKRWYIGAMNDALFIIDKPPRPSNDDVWHDNPNGPEMSLPTWPLDERKVQEIVDEHNREVEKQEAREKRLRDLIHPSMKHFIPDEH